MSDTMCEECGGRYTYPPEDVRPDGTVFCRYCGSLTRVGIDIQGHPAAKRLMSPGSCIETITVVIIGQFVISFFGSAIPFEVYVGSLAFFVFVVFAYAVYSVVKRARAKSEQAYTQNIGASA